MLYKALYAHAHAHTNFMWPGKEQCFCLNSSYLAVLCHTGAKQGHIALSISFCGWQIHSWK